MSSNTNKITGIPARTLEAFFSETTYRHYQGRGFGYVLFYADHMGAIVPATEWKVVGENPVAHDAEYTGTMTRKRFSAEEYQDNVGSTGLIGSIPAGELEKVLASHKIENVLALKKQFKGNAETLNARIDELKQFLGAPFSAFGENREPFKSTRHYITTPAKTIKIADIPFMKSLEKQKLKS